MCTKVDQCFAQDIEDRNVLQRVVGLGVMEYIKFLSEQQRHLSV
jgi:hypothetical protein